MSKEEKTQFHQWILGNGIPDPGDANLAARSGGDTRSEAMEAASQTVRVLAGFPAGSARLGLYFVYNPSRRRELRTKVGLVGMQRKGASAEIGNALKLLVEAGPIQGAYSQTIKPFVFTKTSVSIEDNEQAAKGKLGDWLDLTAYNFCYRILRREERQPVRDPLRETNHRLQQLQQYYAVHPFQPREENDWMDLDRLFDKLEYPAMVEILLGPHPNAQGLREAFFQYAFLVSQINAMDSPLDRHLREEIRRKVLSSIQQDPQADHFVKLHEEIGESLRKPQLLFTIRAWSENPIEARLLASLVAESCFTEGSYQTQQIASDAETLKGTQKAAAQMGIVPPSQHALVTDPELSGTLRPLAQLPIVCPADQLASVFRLPVAQMASAPRTLSLHTDPEPAARQTWLVNGQPTQNTTFLIGEDLEVAPASLKADLLAAAPTLDPYFKEPHSQLAEIRLERKLLQKHLFVCGVPGSGKTTAMFNFVVQLYYQGTPFLIIEPAKTEYRMFKKFRHHPDPKIRELATDLRVFTLGEERVSPLRFNPMIPGEEVTIEEHKGALMACFKASIPIDGPLEGILQEALAEVYENPPEDRHPRLSDLVSASLKILQAKGYDSEISGNLRAALEVRLGLLTKGALGKTLECDENIPSREQLFSVPVVLEMDNLSQENACLMTLLVLTALRQHLRARNRSGSPLKHVVFLEEAHNIAGRTGEGSDGADPKKFAAEYIARMLAEVRALGEGMIIADQLPSAVAPEVVKNTGSKLALRLVANDDREELAGTMLLDETGIAELARCSVGTGFFYREGYYRPRRVQTLNSHALLSATQLTREENGKTVPVQVEFEPPDRRELQDLLKKDNWYRIAAARRRLFVVYSKIADYREQLQDIHHVLQRSQTDFLYRRLEWFKAFDDEALEAIQLDVCDSLKSADVVIADVTKACVVLLSGFAEQHAIPDYFEELAKKLNVFIAADVLPVAGVMVALKAQLETSRGMHDSHELPELDLCLDTAATGTQEPMEPWVISCIRPRLIAQMNRLQGKLQEYELDYEKPKLLPDLPVSPDEITEDSVEAYFADLKVAAVERIQFADAATDRCKELMTPLVYTDPTLNPLLMLDPGSQSPFSEAGSYLKDLFAVQQKLLSNYNAELAETCLVLREIWLNNQTTNEV